METGWLRKSTKPKTNRITKYFGHKPKVLPSASGTVLRNSQTPLSPVNKCTGALNKCEIKLQVNEESKEEDLKQNVSMLCTSNPQNCKENILPTIRNSSRTFQRNKDDPMIKLQSKPLAEIDKSNCCNTKLLEVGVQLPCTKIEESNIKNIDLRTCLVTLPSEHLTVLQSTPTDTCESNCTFDLSLNSQTCNQAVRLDPLTFDTNFTLASLHSSPSEELKLPSTTPTDMYNSNCTFSLSLHSQAYQNFRLAPMSLDTNFTLSSPYLAESEIGEEKELGVSCCDVKTSKRKAVESVYEISKLRKTEVSEVNVMNTSATQWNDSLNLDSEGPIIPIKFRDTCLDFSLTL